MEFVCGSCARRLSMRSVWRGASISRIARRNRSTALPSFAESSSEDLSQVLSTLRSDYFVPAYLKSSQQRLVFQNRFRSQIEGGDSTVSIGDEEIVLQPLDSQTLARQRAGVIQRAYDLIVENDEWQHLLPLLEGMSRVGNTSTNEALCKLIEEAARQQRLSAVLACLEASSRTGLTLKDKWAARSVLRSVRLSVEEADWSAAALSRAIRHTERISRLLATKEHSITPRETKNKQNVSLALTRDPSVTALWLELRAVRAHKSGQEERGAVAIYYERLRGQVHAISAASAERSKEATQASENKDPKAKVGLVASPNFSDQFYPRLSMWQGVLLAQKVLGTKDAQLDKVAERLEAGLDKAADESGKDNEQRRRQLALARDNLA